MNPHTTDKAPIRPALHMPQQAPPVERDARPRGDAADNDSAGIQPSAPWLPLKVLWDIFG
ncbi:hypothetical protein BGM19_38935 [Streptomyces agglomeratus]|uniref:hypothetical protein n=1 Tax=Streptomyces agglomeratus TaxID=285458 RepID=UPI00086EEE6D|nr:hypothetical protein [Streptomyces agglomeratus]OEJ56613.1 hypothetical protein BGM19_38935 [Streptomyces agglomeratus]